MPVPHRPGYRRHNEPTAGDQCSLGVAQDHLDVDAASRPWITTMGGTHAYWNIQNWTCRPPGSPQGGRAGDGSLAKNQIRATVKTRYATSARWYRLGAGERSTHSSWH